MTKKIVKDKFKETPALDKKPVKEAKPVVPTPEPVSKDATVKSLQAEIVALREEMEANRERTIEEIREANSKREPDVLVPETEGFKNPSISSMKAVYTKKQYQKLIEDYKKQNPAKYKLKKSELEEKLKKLS